MRRSRCVATIVRLSVGRHARSGWVDDQGVAGNRKNALVVRIGRGKGQRPGRWAAITPARDDIGTSEPNGALAGMLGLGGLKLRTRYGAAADAADADDGVGVKN